MTDIHVTTQTHMPLPSCDNCGGQTRIYGIEPHPRLTRTDVHTYVCEKCDNNQIVVVPLSGPLQQ